MGITRTTGFDAATAAKAVAMLRKIVAAQEHFFDRNEHGTQDEFQRAADAYHGAVDEASYWLEFIGEKA